MDDRNKPMPPSDPEAEQDTAQEAGASTDTAANDTAAKRAWQQTQNNATDALAALQYPSMQGLASMTMHAAERLGTMLAIAWATIADVENDGIALTGEPSVSLTMETKGGTRAAFTLTAVVERMEGIDARRERAEPAPAGLREGVDFIGAVQMDSDLGRRIVELLRQSREAGELPPGLAEMLAKARPH